MKVTTTTGPTPGHFKQRQIDALREVQDSIDDEIKALWRVHTDVQHEINKLQLEQDAEAMAFAKKELDR